MTQWNFKQTEKNKPSEPHDVCGVRRIKFFYNSLMYKIVRYNNKEEKTNKILMQINCWK